MELIATNDFLYGKFKFVNGSIYDIPERHSKYLKDTGWMRACTDKDKGDVITIHEPDLAVNAPPSEVRRGSELQVDDILHNSKAITE